MVVHGYELLNGITLISVVEKEYGVNNLSSFFYLDDKQIKYESINITKLRKDSRTIHNVIRSSMFKLETKLMEETDRILIGSDIRKRLYSYIKDTLTEEVELEKENLRKRKKD